MPDGDGVEETEELLPGAQAERGRHPRHRTGRIAARPFAYPRSRDAP